MAPARPPTCSQLGGRAGGRRAGERHYLWGYLWPFLLLLVNLWLGLGFVKNSVVVLDLAKVRVLSKLHELSEFDPPVLAG